MSMISYEGIGEVAVTVGMTDEVKAGMVVRMQENETVCPCADGELFCGVAMKQGGSFGTMQVKGFVCVPYSGEITLGWAELVANGIGGVRVGANGVRVMVAHVDTAEHTAVICL